MMKYRLIGGRMLKPLVYCLLFVALSGPVGALAYVVLALMGY